MAGWTGEHLFLVTYDIRCPKRWRKIYRLMEGQGEWLQLSVFQCRLTRGRVAWLRTELSGLIRHGEDHVLIMDLGPADQVRPRVESLGQGYQAIERKPIIL